MYVYNLIFTITSSCFSKESTKYKCIGCKLVNICLVFLQLTRSSSHTANKTVSCKWCTDSLLLVKVKSTCNIFLGFVLYFNLVSCHYFVQSVLLKFVFLIIAFNVELNWLFSFLVRSYAKLFKKKI